MHGLYISLRCRQTADVWRFEAKGGWFSGEIWFCEEILAWGYIVIVSAGIEMSFPCFTLYSAVETQFHKVRQWTIMLLRPIMKHALFFFFSIPPCDMNGFGNGTMQCSCTVHTHTIYNPMGKLIAKWRWGKQRWLQIIVIANNLACWYSSSCIFSCVHYFILDSQFLDVFSQNNTKKSQQWDQVQLVKFLFFSRFSYTSPITQASFIFSCTPLKIILEALTLDMSSPKGRHTWKRREF